MIEPCQEIFSVLMIYLAAIEMDADKSKLGGIYKEF